LTGKARSSDATSANGHAALPVGAAPDRAASLGAPTAAAPLRAPEASGFFAPFRLRDYRFLWPADLAVSWAFEMEIIILGWYVLVTTESVFWLTTIGALHYLGTLLAPGFGVIGDRIGLRNLLCLMRATYALLAAILTTLFLTGQATLPLIFVIAALLGAVRPSDIGVRSALVSHIVPANHLSGAIAISRTTFDMARIVGALTGASLFAAFGIGTAYMMVALCYAVGALLTMMVHAPPDPKGDEPPSPFRDFQDGISYIWNTPHVQAGMWLGFLVNFTAFPISLGLLPYVAKNIYGVDQTGLGVLVASFATGALLGSLTLASMRDRIRAGRLMIKAAALWHLALLAFAFTTSHWLGMFLMVCAGFMQSLSMLSLMFMLLRTSDPKMRGRVMGVRMLAIYSLPLGLMFAGVVIPLIGFPVMAAGYAVGGLALTMTIAIAWRRSIWRLDGMANA